MAITSYLTEKSKSLLIFEISEVEYCISNTVLHSVIKSDNVWQLVASERSKYSLIRIANDYIPLIDLKKLVTKTKQYIDVNSRILLIDYKDMQFGLLVEKIKEIIAIDSRNIKTSLQFNPNLNNLYAEEMIVFEDRKLLLLNMERIVVDTGFV